MFFPASNDPVVASSLARTPPSTPLRPETPRTYPSMHVCTQALRHSGTQALRYSGTDPYSVLRVNGTNATPVIVRVDTLPAASFSISTSHWRWNGPPSGITIRPPGLS